MMRTTIHYGGQEFVVGREVAEVQAEIDGILGQGAPGWLTVNHGRGEMRPAELLIAAGVPIALIDSNDPE